MACRRQGPINAALKSHGQASTRLSIQRSVAQRAAGAADSLGNAASAAPIALRPSRSRYSKSETSGTSAIASGKLSLIERATMTPLTAFPRAKFSEAHPISSRFGHWLCLAPRRASTRRPRNCRRRQRRECRSTDRCSWGIRGYSTLRRDRGVGACVVWHRFEVVGDEFLQLPLPYAKTVSVSDSASSL